MPDRVITAEALITARDGTGDVFLNLARKIDQVGKSAKVSADVERLSQALGQASKTAAQIDGFKVASKGLDAASLAMGRAKQEAGRLAKEVAGLDKPTATLTGKLAQAEKEVDRTTSAFKRQGSVVRDARAALEAAGVPIGKLGAEQQRLKGIIDGTTSAIERQIDVERRAAVEAERVAAAEKQRAAAEAKAKAVAEREAHLRSHGIAHHGFGNYVAGAAAGAVSAHGVMSALEKALEAGAERQSTLVGMKNAGMGDDEIKRAESLATKVSRDAPNLDVSQILELHKEARSAVQHPEEVFELMPDLARATSVLKGLGADNANIADLVKAGESLGLMNDPKRFHTFLDAQVRAMKVMGKTITTEQVYEAAKYSKSAGATLSDDFLNLTMPSLIQEMHGSSAGDALSAIAKRWRGGLAHQHLAVTQLDHMGLLEDPSKIVRAKKSGEIMGYTGKLKGDELLGTDPDRFFREVWEPAAEKMGAKTLADKIKLLNETLPGTAANAGRIFLQQSETLKQHRENYKNAPDLERSVELQKHDPKVAIQTFTAALNDLEAAVTGPTMDALSLGLGRLSGTIRDVADAAKDHPNIAVGVGVAATAGGLVGSGYLAYQISQGFGLRTSAMALDEAAAHLMTVGGGGAARYGAEAGAGTAATVEGTAGALAIPEVATAAAAAVGLIGAAAVTKLVKESFEAQQPGHGGLWAPATPATEAVDRQNLADLQSERAEVAQRIDLQKSKERLPGTSDVATTADRARLAQLDAAIENLSKNLDHLFQSLDREAERGRAMMAMKGPEAAGPEIPPGGLPRPPEPAYLGREVEIGKAAAKLPAFAPAPFGMATAPASGVHPDDDRLSRARASDADALDKLKDDFGLTGFVMGKLDDKAGIVLTSFDGLNGGTSALNTTFGTLGTGSSGLKGSLDILSATALGAARTLAALAMGGGAGGGSGGGSGIINASWGSGGESSGAGFSGHALSVGGGFGSGSWAKSGATKPEVAAYIKAQAAKLGIDPETALRVSQSEGFGTYTGDHGTSFGPFQLHYGGSGIRGMNSGGIGDRFTKETGLDARDPKTWKAQVVYALKTAKREGWGAWHGASRVGIGSRQGLNWHGPVPSEADEHPALKAPPRRPPPSPVSSPGATTAQLEGQAHVRVEIVAKDHHVAGTYVGSRGHIRGSVGTTMA